MAAVAMEMPQGSVLGRTLFSFHLIAVRYHPLCMTIHQYANDIQHYIVNVHAAKYLEVCTPDIYYWLLYNFCTLNSDKSGSAIFGTLLEMQSVG